MPRPPHMIKPVDLPLFNVKRHFKPGLLASRHPIRLTAWILLLVILFPELRWIFATLFALGPFAAGFMAVFISFMLFFGIALLIYYIEYRFYPVQFYADRIEFVENLILRSHHRIPCRNITDIKVKATPLQRYYNVKSVWINLRATASSLKCKDHWIEIPDLKSASKTALELRKIIHDLDKSALMDRPNSA